MLNGFWKLSWVEIKVFVREPMGVFGTLGVPVIIFLLLGKVFAEGGDAPGGELSRLNGPVVFAAIFIALSTVSSLVAIISIYREGGILKRLRATPLRPVTILGAHVAVKLIFTLIGLGLLVLAGKSYYPGVFEVNLLSFTIALLISTLSIISIGFVIASIVPTARFARPAAGAVLFPMLGISGLFMPVEALPAPWATVAGILPVTHAVSLLSGIWNGGAWSHHLTDLAALVTNFLVCSAVSTKVFRCE